MTSMFNRESTFNWILIGFQACGKTTVGQLVADKTGKSFWDSDRLIEQWHPELSCAQIFKRFGESYFRHLEKQIIEQLAGQKGGVIAVGGGTMSSLDNRKRLSQGGYLIYLNTQPDLLKERIWSRPQLPAYLDSSDPHHSFLKLYEERSFIYEQSAHLRIEMDSLTPHQAADQIINHMRHYGI